MNLQEHVPLAPLTTFGVGGAARFFIEAHTEKEVEEAIVFAREKGLPLFPLGNGSNVLVPDGGIAGVVVKMGMNDICGTDEDEDVVIDADAGASWDAVVDAACEHNAFGVENLAGIPGTIGGAAVQNIGAYGAELSDVFVSADVIAVPSCARMQVAKADAAFAYRTSFFKTHPELVITRVALRLKKSAQPNLAYADVARAGALGAPLATPAEIARAIRAIRAEKFPGTAQGGTAGSFFKNPVISREAAEELCRRFAGLPAFPQEDGKVKIPLAWLLDHALSLKGYARGGVRLYEKQPLVMVVQDRATASDVETLAQEVAARVHEATGITIEREVETFGARA